MGKFRDDLWPVYFHLRHRDRPDALPLWEVVQHGAHLLLPRLALRSLWLDDCGKLLTHTRHPTSSNERKIIATRN